jgi:hypothetical protein
VERLVEALYYKPGGQAFGWGTVLQAGRSGVWLRHCATSREVRRLIPDDVTGIFHWRNPSGRKIYWRSITNTKVKVKVTLVQALRLCTGRTAHRGSRGKALLFPDHSTRRGWGVSVTPRPLFIPVKDPVPIVQEAGWAPEPVWTGAENLASTGILSLDRLTRSQSLYRLSYRAHYEH